MTSLRRRIFVGSVLWTVGMIVVASAFFSFLMDASPRAQVAVRSSVHGTLQAPLVMGAGLLCLVAGALQVRRGLTRIDGLRADLAALQGGRGRRLAGAYAAEVQPLVDALNTLLAHRDEAVRRAVDKAGNLAHGLKTPLAIVGKEADAAAVAGYSELATSLRQQVDRMQRQIDYHLAHARAAASGPTTGARSSVHASATGVARAMRKIHADRGIALTVDCPQPHDVHVQREDLDEMLGNLLDNACKWAHARVVVGSSIDRDRIVITIDDDGPGIAEGLRAAVVQRGVRADEATPGTGLGLAIVRDLAELYGGTIAFDRSPQGGCRAVLRLPARS